MFISKKGGNFLSIVSIDKAKAKNEVTKSAMQLRKLGRSLTVTFTLLDSTKK